jgi:hypothetical protein
MRGPLLLPDRASRTRLYRPSLREIMNLALFAQAPSAELVTLGLGKEITYGTAVSPTLSQAQPIGAGWATPAAMTNILKATRICSANMLRWLPCSATPER